MKKSDQSVKISINPEKIPQDLESLLGSVFWKEPGMVGPAADFLSYVWEWQMTESPYAASNWRSYCKKAGLTQSQYSNMLKRLKYAGMVEKKYNKGRGEHEIRASKKFHETLSSMGRIWERFFEG